MCSLCHCGRTSVCPRPTPQKAFLLVHMGEITPAPTDAQQLGVTSGSKNPSWEVNIFALRVRCRQRNHWMWDTAFYNYKSHTKFPWKQKPPTHSLEMCRAFPKKFGHTSMDIFQKLRGRVLRMPHHKLGSKMHWIQVSTICSPAVIQVPPSCAVLFIY